MRIMAVDYGDARTGIAISDPTGFLTGETQVLRERDAARLAQTVADLAVQRGVERIVVGRPLNMDGSAGFRAEKSQRFADRLSEVGGVETVSWDERLTTVDANRLLSDAGKRGKKQKNLVDAVAAALILENYLQFLRQRGDI